MFALDSTSISCSINLMSWTMGKAYVNFEVLSRINEEGGFFVTRAKDNMKYKIITRLCTTVRTQSQR